MRYWLAFTWIIAPQSWNVRFTRAGSYPVLFVAVYPCLKECIAQRRGSKIFIKRNKWIHLGRSEGGSAPAIHFFSPQQTVLSALRVPGSELCSADTISRCLVCKAQAEVLGDALAYSTGPLHFPAFPPSLAHHTLPQQTFSFPTVRSRVVWEKPLYWNWGLAPAPTSQGIPQHFPQPLVPSSPDAWDPCTSPYSLPTSLIPPPHSSLWFREVKLFLFLCSAQDFK